MIPRARFFNIRIKTRTPRALFIALAQELCRARIETFFMRFQAKVIGAETAWQSH
jgi:hypothetical protein